jgi:hypothetical protein
VALLAPEQSRRGRRCNRSRTGWPQIGLEGYAATFAKNDIDIAVLPHLTDADLEKIGISLGQRRKMLATIAGLSGTIPKSPVCTENLIRIDVMESPKLAE